VAFGETPQTEPSGSLADSAEDRLFKIFANTYFAPIRSGRLIDDGRLSNRRQQGVDGETITATTVVSRVCPHFQSISFLISRNP
jgi:hypothetical protein